MGCAIGYSILIIPYKVGGLCAGDVKLLAVFGSIVGLHLIIPVFVYGALLGGVISLYKMLRKQRTLAYGVPLSIGALASIWIPWEVFMK